jgi:peptide/nickel transport system substrate-binding protein
MNELKKWERLLKLNKISRREFLARISALGLSVAVSPALIGGSAKASVPKKGGRLIVGDAGCSTSDSLEPTKMPHSMPQNVQQAVRSHLVELNAKMQAIPELAESWEPSPDAKKWVFKLRQNVEFHNGKTFDAEDVIYSVNYHKGEKSKSAIKAIVKPIKEIKADGKYTVIFTLEEGNADFPFLVSDYHMPMVPAGTKGEEWEKGMGTGPFILEKWEPGIRGFAKRNPNYFKDNRPYFDEVEYLGIADVVARTTALETGKIHYMNRPARKTFHLLGKKKGIKTLSLPSSYHYVLPMRTDTPPFDNNDVRLGLKYAIDREQLVKVVLRGQGYPGNDHPISKTNRYYASELPQRRYDPDKARHYMKKSGLKELTFNLHAAELAFDGCMDTAVLYKESAAKAGVNINIVKEPNDGFWSNVWMKKPWCFAYWAGRPTEDWMFSTVYAAEAGWNDTFWKHERFNKLLKEARAELDEAKRREMYVEMQRIVRDEGGALIPFFANQLSAHSDKVGHDQVAANWGMDGLRIMERWWFVD